MKVDILTNGEVTYTISIPGYSVRHMINKTNLYFLVLVML